MGFTRRELLQCLAAGGAVVAGELWVPGRKLISLPNEIVRPNWATFNVTGIVVGDRVRVFRADNLEVVLDEKISSDTQSFVQTRLPPYRDYVVTRRGNSFTPVRANVYVGNAKWSTVTLPQVKERVFDAPVGSTLRLHLMPATPGE